MTALAARGIRKSFGRRQVLTGVDLEVAAGELVAVVGENGTGKTTLLRILAGDLRPDAGSVAIDGRPGYCPQTVVLDEALTVDQNVSYFQAAYGIDGTGRAGELIERLGYAACRGQRVGTLSGETKQKLSLPLALMHDPPVLLLDEPYQGFDWQTYLAFWGLAGELRNRGTATVGISHLVFEHERFDRICHLVRGDLEGFFLIIMIAMLDTFLENPVDNPLANKPMLEFFPSYGPTQFAAAGAFHHQVLVGMAAASLAWTAVFALLGLAVLRLRMPRPARAAAPSAGRSPAGTPSTATPSTGTASTGARSTSPHHQTLTAAVAQTSGGPGRNPGESGLPADQRVVPPPAARAG